MYYQKIPSSLIEKHTLIFEYVNTIGMLPFLSSTVDDSLKFALAIRKFLKNPDSSTPSYNHLTCKTAKIKFCLYIMEIIFNDPSILKHMDDILDSLPDSMIRKS